jgi:hypothetical protein
MVSLAVGSTGVTQKKISVSILTGIVRVLDCALLLIAALLAAIIRRLA